MKFQITTLALLFAILMNAQSNSSIIENPLNGDYWSQPDKQKHIMATMVISTATFTFLSVHPTYKNFSPLKKRLISFGSAMLVGLIKETIDSGSENNYFSNGDMFANMSGAFAFQLSATIPLNIKKKEETYLFAAN